MANYKCTSCGGTYTSPLRDGSLYFHTCTAEQITHAVTDATGKVVTAESRVPLPNRRDENVLPGIFFVAEGAGPLQCKRAAPNPEERNQSIFVDAKPGIISEGAGAVQV